MRISRTLSPVLAIAILFALIPGAGEAAVDQASAHFIVPNWSFQLCRERVASALRAENMSAVENGGNTGDFRGYSNVRHDTQGALDTVVINCWSTNDPAAGGIRVTFACASQTPNNHANDLCVRLEARVFNNQPASSSCSSPVGTWKWWNGGTAIFGADGSASLSDPYGSHRGNWDRTNDGRFHVHWDYPTDDYFTLLADGRTMTGNFNGNTGTSTRQGSCGGGLR